jgi:hypothetical protein
MTCGNVRVRFRQTPQPIYNARLLCSETKEFNVIRPTMILACLMVAGVFAAPAAAQDLTPKQAAPSIKLVHPGWKRFYVDLDYILGLTTKEEQKQLPQLKEFGFDPFLVGVGGERPLGIDTLTDAKTLRYLAFIPISDLKKFRKDNLEAADIESKKLGKTLYRLRDEFEVWGFLQFQNDYAAISGKRADVPAAIADPRPAYEKLVAKYDLVLEILNSQHSEAAQKVRKQQYDANIRKELFAMVERTKLETDDQFELRKLFTDIQLDELGRLYVGAKQARLGLVIDEKQADVSTMDFLLDPIPETELAASVQLLAKKSSDFANIARNEDAILSARINHPLDEMRQQNFVKLSLLLRKQAQQEFDKETDATKEEKQNRKKATDLFFDMIDAGLKSGVVDAFAEAHPSENGKNTIVGGILAVDGNAFIEALKLFPKASKGQKVELNVDEAGDVKIHKFTAATKEHALFNDFFGSDVIYLGTSKKAVWYAAGENALVELKAAITKCGEPNTGKADDPVADVVIKLGPWMKLRQALHAGDDEDEELLKLRQFAVDAFLVGDDSLKLNLKRVGDHVEGLMTGQPGILRFIGKMMADFSKENFDD